MSRLSLKTLVMALASFFLCQAKAQTVTTTAHGTMPSYIDGIMPVMDQAYGPWSAQPV